VVPSGFRHILDCFSLLDPNLTQLQEFAAPPYNFLSTKTGGGGLNFAVLIRACNYPLSIYSRSEKTKSF
jgi:hypothetical protein